MSARTTVVVRCDQPRCDATYPADTAWAAHEAWLAGWTKRYHRRKRPPTGWVDLCPKHADPDDCPPHTEETR